MLGLFGKKKEPETLLKKEKDRYGGSGFDPTGLERAAKAAREIDASAHARLAFDVIQAREATKRLEHGTRQAAYEMRAREYEMQSVGKEGAEARQTLAAQTDHANRQAEYADQLERRRYAANLGAQRDARAAELQRHEASLARQEELRRRTLRYEAELREKTELKRAEAEATARARAERETHDLSLARMRAEAAACALGWACWKTYLGRPETDNARMSAMKRLGNGLFDAGHHEDALSVEEAELAMKRRLGVSEGSILDTQSNLALTYTALGRLEDSRRVHQDIYSGHVRLHGEEHNKTITSALNYSLSLTGLEHFEEAKPLLRKTIPVARRVLGENHDLTLRMSLSYAISLYLDAKATLEDLREAVTTLEDTERAAQQVFGGAHPLTGGIECSLRNARAALGAREGDDVGAVRAALDALKT